MCQLTLQKRPARRILVARRLSCVIVSWNFGIIKKHTFLPQYQKSKCLSVSEKNESPKGFAILYIHAPFWHNFDFSHYDKSVPNCLNMKKTLYKKTMSPLILHFMALPPLSVPTPHMIHTNQLLICATVQLMRQMDFPYYMKGAVALGHLWWRNFLKSSYSMRRLHRGI